jgi:hypothetical protein
MYLNSYVVVVVDILVLIFDIVVEMYMFHYYRFDKYHLIGNHHDFAIKDNKLNILIIRQLIKINKI